MSDRDQQRAAHIAFMREKIQEALNDPRPDIPAAEVFAKLRAIIALDIESEAQTPAIVAEQ
jgi:hypothetical protein